MTPAGRDLLLTLALAGLGGLMVLLLLAGIGQDLLVEAGVMPRTRYNLDLNNELTPFAILSALNLAAAAGLMAAIARRSGNLRWWGLAAVFLLLAADEAFSFHERLGVIGGDLMYAATGAWLHFAWWLPLLPILALAALWLAPVLWTMTPRFRLLVLACGAAFLTGAVLMEFSANLVCDADNGDFTGLGCRFEIFLEEALEGLSIVSLLFVLRAWLKRVGARA